MEVKILFPFLLLFMFTCEQDSKVVHFVEQPYLGGVVEVFDEHSPKLTKCMNTIVVVHNAEIIRHSTFFDGHRMNETFRLGSFKGCDSLSIGVDLHIGNRVGSSACNEGVYYYYWEVSELDTITRRSILENTLIAEDIICGDANQEN